MWSPAPWTLRMLSPIPGRFAMSDSYVQSFSTEMRVG
jgi:hypothetical protein